MRWLKAIFKRLLKIVELIVNYKLTTIYACIFWTIILSLTFWNIYILLSLIFKRFIGNSISIGVETTFLHWNNTFPAVTICLTKNRMGLNMSMFDDYGLTPNSSILGKYYKNLHDYMFTNINQNQVSIEQCFDYNATCGVNITLLRERYLPRSCQVFMSELSFMQVNYTNCEDIFKFHELEMGYCFMSNNILDYGAMADVPLKFSAHNGKPIMKFLMKAAQFYKYEVYVHSPEESVFYNLAGIDSFTYPLLYSYNLEEMYNDEDVAYEHISQRNCLFPHEGQSATSPFYSFASCAQDIRIKLELLHCNCTLYTSPSICMHVCTLRLINFLLNSCIDSELYCDIFGMQCILNADVLSKAKQEISAQNVCLNTCGEPQITLVGTSELNEKPPNGYYAFEMDIANTPSVRYRRSLTQTKTDLIVSIGGMLGLFMGCSLINFAEFLSILFQGN